MSRKGSVRKRSWPNYSKVREFFWRKLRKTTKNQCSRDSNQASPVCNTGPTVSSLSMSVETLWRNMDFCINLVYYRCTLGSQKWNKSNWNYQNYIYYLYYEGDVLAEPLNVARVPWCTIWIPWSGCNSATSFRFVRRYLIKRHGASTSVRVTSVVWIFNPRL